MKIRTPLFVFLVASWLACAPCLHSEEAPRSKIASALQPFVNSKTLAGAVAIVATKDKIVSEDVVGYSDVEAQTLMKKDAIFWIASMTKPMTATALMMLVDEGKVKLDDPVSKYLPEFGGQMLVTDRTADQMVLKKPAKAPTVRMLLNHTSGLVLNLVPEKSGLDSLSLRERCLAYALTPLQFEPGSKFQYNNPGINTAGRIIEVVSGISYEDFMQQRVFDPLGMKETTFWPSDAQVARLAKTYKPNKERTAFEVSTIGYLKPPYSDRKRAAFPGGGLFSTTQDLAAFCRMILGAGEFNGKRLISADAIKEMGAVQTEGLTVNVHNPNDGGAYGLGWFVIKTPHAFVESLSPGTFGHAGAFQTIMWIDPTKQRAYILMMQHNGFAGKEGNSIRPAFFKAASE